MRKIFLSVVAFLFIFGPAFSQTVDLQEDEPEQDAVSLNLESLYGIWEGKDRFVFIEPGEEKTEEQGSKENSPVEIVILLKDFYGWYYDRVAEPAKYSEAYPRTRNSATPRNAEHVSLEINQLNNSSLDNTFQLALNYSRRQTTYVPIVILNDNMYLDFYVQDSENPAFYRGNAISKGITVSEQSVNENLNCFYIDGDDIYNIRYWLTDMDYSDRKVSLNYGDKSFNVDAHIISGDKNYACVPGRGKIIRNVQTPEKLYDKDYFFTEDKKILMTKQEQYLTKLADKNTFDQLMEIVKKANSRRRPEPDPVFPESHLDYHWDIIDYLEKNNTLIQEVRERQREFGVRGKDIGK